MPLLRSPSKPTAARFDERDIDRQPLRIETTLFNRKAGVIDVVITDLTNQGCRLASDQPLTVGASVTLALTTRIEAVAWVAWRAEGAVGVEFAHPLPEALFEAIAREAANRP